MQTGSWLPGWGLGVGTTSRGPASQASQNQDAAPSATDPEFPLGCHLSSVVNRVKAPKEVHILVPRTCARTHTHVTSAAKETLQRGLRIVRREDYPGVRVTERLEMLCFGDGGGASSQGMRTPLEAGEARTQILSWSLQKKGTKPCPHLVLSQQDPSQTPEQQDNTVWFPEASRVG